MDKKLCDKCKKEIKLKKCYEVLFGKANIINDGFWNALNLGVLLLCPDCYKPVKKLLKK